MFQNVSRLFHDVLLLALAGFVSIVILVLPYINPEGKKADESTIPPGTIIVEIRWPDGLNADVDLWVKAPDYKPVGYSNKSGPVFNLLRDDLGNTNDMGKLNYENAYTRGCPKGEYAVNVHMYSNRTNTWPIPVFIRVTKKDPEGRDVIELFPSREVELVENGQEITVYRWSMQENCHMVRDSLHDIFIPLRSAT